MKHYRTFLLFSLFSIIQLSAQIVDCDCDNRYSTEIFSDVNVETVTYSDVHNLQMDIYTPVGDVCSNRPLLIFAHGGTFIFGSKTNPSMVELCESFAKKGYVTASINYRLAVDIVGLWNQFTYYTDTQSAYEVVLNAVTDGKAAVRYFRKDVAENGNSYGIDQTQIWGGGNSAGGVLFLHVGHVQSIEEFIAPLDPSRADIATTVFDSFSDQDDDNDGLLDYEDEFPFDSDNNGVDDCIGPGWDCDDDGIANEPDIEGNSGNSGYSSQISGVISLAGALHRSEYLDLNDVPSVFCHGDADGVVPYDCNGFQNNSNYDQLCGGGALYPEMESLGLVTELLTFPNDSHCPWDASSSKMNQVKSFVSNFLYNNIDCASASAVNEFKNSKELLYQLDMLGRPSKPNQKGLVLNVYKDGSVKKEYIIY